MPNKPWKQAERRLAAIFGTRRRPLSGGNQGGGRDDAIHDTLFLENKYSARHAIWTLYRDTRDKARAEGKTPVIGLQEKGKPGVLLVIHSDDFVTVFAEYLKCRGYPGIARLIAGITKLKNAKEPTPTNANPKPTRKPISKSQSPRSI